MVFGQVEVDHIVEDLLVVVSHPFQEVGLLRGLVVQVQVVEEVLEEEPEEGAAVDSRRVAAEQLRPGLQVLSGDDRPEMRQQTRLTLRF